MSDFYTLPRLLSLSVVFRSIHTQSSVTAALASHPCAWPPNVMHHPVSQTARELGDVTVLVASRLVERER